MTEEPTPQSQNAALDALDELDDETILQDAVAGIEGSTLDDPDDSSTIFRRGGLRLRQRRSDQIRRVNWGSHRHRLSVMFDSAKVDRSPLC